LSCWRNVSNDDEAVVGSRWFHALTAAAEKARSPKVERRVDGNRNCLAIIIIIIITATMFMVLSS